MKYDYRQILKAEFDRRSAVNSAYSLRAFARDLRVPAPQLSAVFRGKKGLSKEKASAVAKALEFSVAEEKRFVAAVTAAHGRSKLERETALRKISRLTDVDGIATIATAKFEVVADWYHAALLQLMETRSFRWHVNEIADALGIPARKVKNAIDALTRAGLLRQTAEGYQKTKAFMRTEDIPSRAIRLNHQQLISLAVGALDDQNIQERDFSSVTVAIDPDRVPEIKLWLKDFREKFCLDASQGDARTDVYALNMQFFRLTKSKKENTQ